MPHFLLCSPPACSSLATSTCTCTCENNRLKLTSWFFINPDKNCKCVFWCFFLLVAELQHSVWERLTQLTSWFLSTAALRVRFLSTGEKREKRLAAQQGSTVCENGSMRRWQICHQCNFNLNSIFVNKLSTGEKRQTRHFHLQQHSVWEQESENLPQHCVGSACSA